MSRHSIFSRRLILKIAHMFCLLHISSVYRSRPGYACILVHNQSTLSLPCNARQILPALECPDLVLMHQILQRRHYHLLCSKHTCSQQERQQSLPASDCPILQQLRHQTWQRTGQHCHCQIWHYCPSLRTGQIEHHSRRKLGRAQTHGS